MYLVSLYFDDVTVKRLESHIKGIAKATGNEYMVKYSVPPHMTVAAVQNADEDVLVRIMAEAAGNFKSGEINIVSVGAFLPGVLYAMPVLNEYLHNLCSRINDSLSDVEGISLDKKYQPFSWVPHITLAKKLDNSQLLKGIEVLQNEFGAFKGKVVRLGLARTNPYEEII